MKGRPADRQPPARGAGVGCCHLRSTVKPVAVRTPGMFNSLSFLFPTRTKCSMVRKSVRPTDSACREAREGACGAWCGMAYRKRLSFSVGGGRSFGADEQLFDYVKKRVLCNPRSDVLPLLVCLASAGGMHATTRSEPASLLRVNVIRARVR